MGSSAFSQTNLVDQRVTGVEGSTVAIGGGSTSIREIIPEDPLRAILDTIQATDRTRSEDLRTLVDRTAATLDRSRAQEREVVGQAIATVAAQRASETETLGQTIKGLAPLILGGILLMSGRR